MFGLKLNHELAMPAILKHVLFKIEHNPKLIIWVILLKGFSMLTERNGKERWTEWRIIL